MISKEEVNQLQKLTPSITAVHSVAACIISGKISSHRTTENSSTLNVSIGNDADNERVWTKTVVTW
ncbi:hypothetical protein REB14_22055 [Chryseobacterium sp. ES2]|uniref:Uncharacterized protein n=1 Tax=Chryseobacterium metallicongregator TaxID=3073042 RepID=A0ABU1EAV9_9FLAO|nr:MULTISPECIES: hypothetical protein [Chryseobacterium]MDR4954876.1 hypothetical protein [Chryseobacterium sp. ES2]